MAANNVILNKQTLIDLSKDTVSESHVEAGITFHKADGTQGIGTKGKISIKDVYEWPTASFDPNVVYRKRCVLGISNFYYDSDNDDRLIRYDYGLHEINNLLQGVFGAEISMYYRQHVYDLISIDTSQATQTHIIVAYIEDTNELWMYSDSNWSNGGSSEFVGLLLGIPSADNLTPVFDEDDIVETGTNITYILIKDAYARYVNGKLSIVEPKYGTKVITDNMNFTEVDTSDYSSVFTNRIMTYWATNVNNLPDLAPAGSIGIVLEGDN